MRDLDAVAAAIDEIDAGLPFEIEVVENARAALQKARASAEQKPNPFRRLAVALTARVSS